MSQSVNLTMEPPAAQPTLAEQAAAMDAAAATKPVAPDRPDWLPEQFSDVAAYNKSFTDSRAEVTRLQQELAKLKPADTPKEVTPADPLKAAEPPKPADAATTPPKTAEELAKAPADEQAKAAEDALKAAKVDPAPFQEEFNRTGNLSAESIAKIAESLKGQFGDGAEALVRSFVQGQQAQVQAIRSQAFTEAGGEQQFAQMQTWAKDNLSAGEKDAFNRAVTGSDTASAMLAIRGLRASFERANGRSPRLISGDNKAPTEANAPFRSTREMVEAINDPRYGSDPAYRADVSRRIQGMA